jgi:hypothetical protein
MPDTRFTVSITFSTEKLTTITAIERRGGAASAQISERIGVCSDEIEIGIVLKLAVNIKINVINLAAQCSLAAFTIAFSQFSQKQSR